MKKKDTRKLTKEEELRKENFEKSSGELESKGYKASKLTVSALYANIMGLVVTAPIILLLYIWFEFANGESTESIDTATLIFSLLIPVIIIILIVVHELIHGACGAIFAKNHWKAISFGFIVKYLTPYCSCNEALTKIQYVIFSMTPTIIIGIIPTIIAVLTASVPLFFIGAIMILSGGGDVLITIKILSTKTSSKDTLYFDHPYEIGVATFSR